MSVEIYPSNSTAHDFLVLLFSDATACVVWLQENFHLVDDTLLHWLPVFILKLCTAQQMDAPPASVLVGLTQHCKETYAGHISTASGEPLQV